MVVAKQANIRYKTISAALNIIDPEGAFLPGTIEHNWATEKILAWMAEMEPNEVLRKSESARNMFRHKQNIWQICRAAR